MDNSPGSLGSSASKSRDLVELNKLVYSLQAKVAMLEQQQHQPSGTKSPRQGNVPSSSSRIDEATHGDLSAQPNLSTFAGPTSATFSFGLAKLMLDQENTSVTGEASDTGLELELAGSVSLSRETDEDEYPADVGASESSRDLKHSHSLHGMEKAHALHLLQTYHECVGVLHPIVDTSSMETQIDLLWTTPDTPLDKKLAGNFPHLKMVLAIGLLAEGGGSSAISEKIYHELQPVVMNVVFAKSFNLDGQILLLLMAFFHMFKDDCRLASRHVAIACRLMMEAGLHQKHILTRRFTQSETRAEAINVLLASIILDRQLNFNAGLPFTLKDTDIEITQMDTQNPYAKAMAAYIRIGPPAWAAVTDERGRAKQRVKDEDFDFVDYQAQRWLENLPAYLHLDKTGDDSKYTDQGTQFLRFILYLRANQFRIVITRPLLFSSHTYMENRKRVRIVAQIARDTIETIEEMNEKYDLYKKQQPNLNLFLSSALSTLFLVFIHGLREERTCPSDEARDLAARMQDVREGINKGLALVQSYSTYRSSQRLWQKFAGPHGLLSRLCLADQTRATDTATSTLPTSGSDVPSQSDAGYDRCEEQNTNGYSQGPTAALGAEDLSYTYPPTEGFRPFLGTNPFQAYDFSEDYSPLPFLNMNPLVVSNDIDVFYDNMWDDNMF